MIAPSRRWCRAAAVPTSHEGALARVRAPTLLIVGGDDLTVIAMNRDAARRLPCEHRLEIVPGASHLFEEPGTLEQIVGQATQWFLEHFAHREEERCRSSPS